MGKVVKSVANIAVSAGVGFVAGGPWGAVIAASAAAFNDFESSKLSNNGSTPSAQTVRSSKAPIRFILGRASTGGVLAWAQEDHTVSYKHEWLHLVYVLSEGEITGVDEIYLNEKLITEYPSEDYSYEVRINETEPDQFLMARCPDWKDTQIGRGISYLRLSLRYDPEVFTSIPTVRCVVRGLPLYDPRNGKTEYSDNPALMTLWYLRNRCNVPDDEIIMDAFSSAANVCDETVTNPDKSTSKRYTAAAVIGADEKRTDVLQKLETTMAGNLILSGGRWALQAGAYYGPATFTITEPMVVGPVSGSTEVDNADAVNVMTGTFIDPQSSWAQTDFPSVYMQDWITADGGEQSSSLTLDYVTDAYQAQRLANIALKKNRGAHSISMTLNLSGYACRPGMIVTLDLPSLNMTSGEFVVNDWKYDPSQGISVTLQTTDSGIWDDAVGQAYNPFGYISLPTGGMDIPTDLKWSVQTYGDSVQGVLSWGAVAMADSYVIHVRTQSENPADVYSVDVPATSTRVQLHGLVAGRYNMSVAAKGGSYTSGEATIGVEINVPPVPISVNVSTGNYEVSLTPVLGDDQTLGGGTWEYYYDQTGSIADSEVAGKATYLGQGLSYTQVGLEANTIYYYWVRGRNAYGVGDWYKLQAQTQNNADQIMQVISGKITNSDLNKDLQSDIGKISGDGDGSVNQRIDDAKSDLNQSIASADNDAKTAQAAANKAQTGANNAQNSADNALNAANKVQSNLDSATTQIDSDVQKAQTSADNAQKTADKASSDLKDSTDSLNIEVQQAQASADKANTDLKSATESLNNDIDGLNQQVSANKNGITTLTNTVNTNNTATNKRIDGLNSTVGSVSSNLASEEQTRANEDSALSKRIDTTNTSVGNVSAALSQEQQARVAGDSASTKAISNLEASQTTGYNLIPNPTFSNNAYGWSTQNGSLGISTWKGQFSLNVNRASNSGVCLVETPLFNLSAFDSFKASVDVRNTSDKDITVYFDHYVVIDTTNKNKQEASGGTNAVVPANSWKTITFTGSDTDDSSQGLIRVYWYDTSVQSLQTNNWKFEYIGPATQAAVSEEQQARIDGDEANASDIKKLDSRITQNSANITDFEQTQATTNKSLTQQISTAKSAADNAQSTATQAQQTEAQHNSATNSRIDGLATTVGDNKANADQQFKTLSTQQSAQASDIKSLTANTQKNASDIQSLSHVQSTDNEALSQKIEDVAASFGSGFNLVPNSNFSNNALGWSSYGGVSISAVENAQGECIQGTGFGGSKWQGIQSKRFAVTQGRKFSAAIAVYFDCDDTVLASLELYTYPNATDINDVADINKYASIPPRKWVSMGLSGNIPDGVSAAQLWLTTTNAPNGLKVLTTNWQCEVQGPVLDAAIQSEATARANDKEALTQQINTAKSAADNAQSTATQAQNTEASHNKATNDRIDVVTTKVDNNSTAITQETSARQEGDTANEKALQQLSGKVEGNSSAITAEASARQTADSANTKALNDYKSQTDKSLSGIISQQSTLADAQNAQANSLKDLSASFGSGSNLIPNSVFDDNARGWTTQRGTLAVSYWNGQQSLKINRMDVGTGSSVCLVESPLFNVTTGQFTASVDIQNNGDSAVTAHFDHYIVVDPNNSSKQQSVNGTSAVIPPNSWMTLTFSGQESDRGSHGLVRVYWYEQRVSSINTNNWKFEIMGPATNAAIQDEATARANDKQALTQQIQSAQSTASNAQSAVISLQNTEAQHNSATNSRIDGLNTSVNNNKANADQQFKTLSSNQSAQATEISNVAASFGSGYNAVVNPTFANNAYGWSTQNGTLSVSTWQGQFSLNINRVNSSGVCLVESPLFNLNSNDAFKASVDVQNTSSKAVTVNFDHYAVVNTINTSKQQPVNGTSVEIPANTWKTITFTGTETNDSSRGLIRVYWYDTSVQSLQTNNWKFEFLGPATSAAIQSEATARANDKEALTQQIQSAQSAASNAQSSITSLQNTEAQHNSATNSRIDDLSTTVGENSSKIQQESQTRTSQNAAVTKQLNQLSTTVSNNQSVVQNDYYTKSQTDSAVANAKQTVQASSNKNASDIASTQQYLNAGVKDGNVWAGYTLKLNANGHATGFGLYNNARSTQAIFDVDSFAVGSGQTGDTYPFMISGNTVYIKSAMLGSAEITNRLWSPNYWWNTDTDWGGMCLMFDQGKIFCDQAYIKGQVHATTFSASSGTSGARTEMTERGTRVYDENGQIRIKLGNLS
ncbi:Chromosome partition protein Smc [Halomonadaceae bacterium LMG 33818]|uniref:phage tail tip protein J-related protein n=1 Tax=Cernens ardua TaxID=3402176 RepID=UPI003EDC7D9A